MCVYSCEFVHVHVHVLREARNRPGVRSPSPSEFLSVSLNWELIDLVRLTDSELQDLPVSPL